jgi:hypothetical protein
MKSVAEVHEAHIEATVLVNFQSIIWVNSPHHNTIKNKNGTTIADCPTYAHLIVSD